MRLELVPDIHVGNTPNGYVIMYYKNRPVYSKTAKGLCDMGLNIHSSQSREPWVKELGLASLVMLLMAETGVRAEMLRKEYDNEN